MANKPRFAAKPPEVEGNPVHNEVLLGLPSPECDAVFSQLTFVQLRNKTSCKNPNSLLNMPISWTVDWHRC
jgi:hypothetical protein